MKSNNRIYLEDIVYFDAIGPDPSVGKENEIYGKLLKLILPSFSRPCFSLRELLIRLEMNL
jgi:hypothetical protein